ncbi:MAG: alanine dehydrogenase [Proteobacteria bacterium]|nr:MAG: alanine dehydrogenase [Pseudomonadota bacterium]
MQIGIPKEIKTQENRVGLTPQAVAQLVRSGHAVRVEAGAGVGSGYADAEYQAAGAQIASVEAVWQAALVVKVKEPQPVEIARLGPAQTLFCYLHLAPDAPQTDGLLASGCTAIAFETVEDGHRRLPLLAPMSEVAGCLAPQVGAMALHAWRGGRGVLLGGVPGVAPADVLVLGGGVVGTHAARVALGMGADVTLLDRDLNRLKALDVQFGGRVKTAHAGMLHTLIRQSDMIIGAVLIPGAKAPHLIRRADLAELRTGCVLVDVAIDQGGCFETSRPTTHDDPTYLIDGVVHYCVANMPGAVSRTATQALTAAVLPYAQTLADQGWQAALRADPGLAKGLNVHAGGLYEPNVAEVQGKPLAVLADALA